MNKKHLKRIEEFYATNTDYNFTDQEMQEMKDTIDLLCEREVLYDMELDGANCYLKVGDFSIFSKWIKKQEKNKKKERRSNRSHDYIIAIISAVLGAVVGAIMSGFITYYLFINYHIGA